MDENKSRNIAVVIVGALLFVPWIVMTISWGFKGFVGGIIWVLLILFIAQNLKED